MRCVSRTRGMLAAAGLALAACGRAPELAVDSSAATGGAPPPTETAAARSSSAPIRIEHSTTRDLTGDGVPERFHVRATGSRYDSLNVRLEIRDGKSSVPLYVASWNTIAYFRYEPAGAPPDSAAARERITRRNLARLLSDSAFVAPRLTMANGKTESVDRATVEYHLAELAWRRTHGLADTAATPREADEALGKAGPPSAALRAEADSVVQELRSRPSFTWFQGGELTYTIAWSDRQHTFVRAFSCC